MSLALNLWTFHRKRNASIKLFHALLEPTCLTRDWRKTVSPKELRFLGDGEHELGISQAKIHMTRLALNCV